MVYSCTVLALCLLLAPFAYCQTTAWSVNNRQVTKDGEPFIFKGVNYSPIPPGAYVSEKIQWGDLFHSGWAHLHDRDIPLMREAGVNAIRTYFMQLKDPITKQDLDHNSFFDKLYNNGLDPIYVMLVLPYYYRATYLGPFDQQPTQPSSNTFQTVDGKWYQLDDSKEQENSLQREIDSNIMAEFAQEYGYHPAVIGFSLGTEIDDVVIRSDCKSWEWLDHVAARVKEYAPNKLTLTSLYNGTVSISEANRCHSMAHLDAWGISSYVGNVSTGFGSTFDDYVAVSTKPLLITEFGCTASTRDEDGKFIMLPDNSKLQADYFSVHWRDIASHSAIVSGGFVYSWVDEWWKVGSAQVQEGIDTPYPGFPGEWSDPETSGMMAVLVDCSNIDVPFYRRDTVLPRAMYYVMGKEFGAWTDLPDQTFTPISYPRCNGEWIGEPVPLAFAPIGPPVAPPQPIFYPPVQVEAPLAPTPESDVPATANEPESQSPSSVPSSGWSQQITATVTILLKVAPSMVEVNSVANELSALLDLPRSAIPNINVDIDRSTDNTTIVQFVIQNVVRGDGSRVDPVAAALELRNLIAANDQRIAESRILRGMQVVTNEPEKQVSGAVSLLSAPILCLVMAIISFINRP